MDDFDARRASLDLVTAFVNNNKLNAAELPTLLGDVFKAISGFDIQTDGRAKPEQMPSETVTPSELAPAPKTKPAQAAAASARSAKIKSPSLKSAAKTLPANTPAVSIEASLADPGVIVSLITGEKFKMLKRHLNKHGLTEAEYKTRFNLPDDYPTVAPAYAALRRDVATKMHGKAKVAGAGGKPADTPVPVIKAEAPKPVKAKAVPQKKASELKQSAAADTTAPKKPVARRTRAKAAGADTAQKNAAKAAKVPAAAAPTKAEPVSQVDTLPHAEPAKAAEASKKTPAIKPAPKRRMARQPAGEIKPVDAAGTPAPVKEAKAADASPVAPSASPKPAARKSRKSGGAPATSGDGAKVEPARKERKTLSPAYR